MKQNFISRIGRSTHGRLFVWAFSSLEWGLSPYELSQFKLLLSIPGELEIPPGNHLLSSLWPPLEVSW